MEYSAKSLEKYGFKFILYGNIIKTIGIVDKKLKLLNKYCMDLCFLFRYTKNV